MNNDWKSQAEADLGVRLENWQALSGGDFAKSYCATVVEAQQDRPFDKAVSIGSQLFIKTHANPPPLHFSTEAQGLHWLAQTSTVRVPTVLGVCDDIPYLALAWIEEGRQRTGNIAGEAEFGSQLAALHKAPFATFGREDKRSTGSLGLPNEPCQRWAEFYATQRLLPLAKIAAEKQALTTKLIVAIEKLASQLDEHINATTLPSLLHGDLWAGNRLVDTKGQSWVIDPASHGGHREFDLAMMRLFGGYSDACFNAYHAAYALDDGWQERVALHQLAPLIVHAIKFGSSYIGPTRDALSQYVAVL